MVVPIAGEILVNIHTPTGALWTEKRKRVRRTTVSLPGVN